MFSKLNLYRLALKKKLQQDPYYRMRSLVEVSLAAELGIKIDVNQASIDDWLRLPGISIHQARTLVELVAMGTQLLCLEDIAAVITVPLPRLKPLEPVLYFGYYDRERLFNPQRVNPNTASVEQLTAITWLSLAEATKIVNNRETHGFYRNLADFQRRLDLSPEIISQLMYYLRF